MSYQPDFPLICCSNHFTARGEVEPNKAGLGLGLYIASEIAKAQVGTLDVQLTQDETHFSVALAVKVLLRNVENLIAICD